MLPVWSVWSQPRSTIVLSSACRLLLGIFIRVDSWSWVPGPLLAISSRRSRTRAADLTGPALLVPFTFSITGIGETPPHSVVRARRSVVRFRQQYSLSTYVDRIRPLDQ